MKNRALELSAIGQTCIYSVCVKQETKFQKQNWMKVHSYFLGISRFATEGDIMIQQIKNSPTHIHRCVPQSFIFVCLFFKNEIRKRTQSVHTDNWLTNKNCNG